MNLKRQNAQSTIEYTLLILMFIFIGYTGFKIFQKSLNEYFNRIAIFRAGNLGMLP